jgi:hypothetical protein
VKSHAKASSVGSSFDRGTGLGAATLLLALVGLLALASSALAGTTRLHSSSFGSLASPEAVAVDNSGTATDGDVYVVDTAEGTVSRFTSAGAPDNFSSVDADISGNSITGFFFESNAAQVAIAPAGSPGGTAGDIYVASSITGNVQIFAPSGDHLGTLDGSGDAEGFFGESCGVAVDASDGSVYVGTYGQRIWRYTPTTGTVSESDYSGGIQTSIPTCNLAADSGSVYAGNTYESGALRKYKASDFSTESTPPQVESTLFDASATSVAVDPANGNVYVDEASRVSVFSSTGAFLYSFGSGDIGANSNGVGVAKADGKAYVADRENGEIDVFDPPIPLPDAITEDAGPVGETTALLHGKVGAAGGSEASCEFQYIPNSLYRAKEIQELTVSATGGTFTLSFEGQSTSNIAFNASAATVASKLNELSAIGGTQKFVTVSGGPGNSTGSAPYTITFGGSLAYKDVEQITTDASLLSGASASATIATLQEGQAPSFAGASSVPCSPPGPFNGSAKNAVSGEANGLTPATDYAFRVLGTSVAGSSFGEARIFHTSLAPTVSEESVSSVSEVGAILSAKINPKGGATTYHVEYGTTTAYGQSTPESAPVGGEGDESPHTVSVHIGGLEPGTAYHFRFVATNGAASVNGADTSFATFPALPSFAPCPNDGLRTGFGARLPDCRAYEQATPIDKHGANAQDKVNFIQAASGGDRITFFTNGGLPTTGGSALLYPFMASRGPGGWSSDGLQPATDPGFTGSIIGWSDDLSTTLVGAPAPGSSNPENPEIALYLRDSDTAAFQLGPVGVGSNAFLAGFAADSGHLIFEAAAKLLGAPTFATRLYDLDHGNLTLAGRVPAGAATSCDDESGPACVVPAGESVAGAYEWFNGTRCVHSGGASCSQYTQAQNAISRDGSRVFFTDLENKQVYVREDGSRTTEVSASQRTTPDPNGEKPAAFMAASSDGSKVFFASCEKLTDDSTAVSNGEGSCTTADQGQDLYSYDLDTGDLTDLSVDSNVGDAKGAAVQGVLGTSQDGSYVYFAANGVLAPGASPGNCVIHGVAGTCNLYVSHDGVTTFIARVRSGGASNSDENDWIPLYYSGTDRAKTSRVSADGHTLLFSSTESLTGYDNHLPSSSEGCGGPGSHGIAGEPCAELYRYSAPEEELTCVSCNPTGVPPAGDARVNTEATPGFTNPLRTAFLTRNLSADGKRAFFESEDALLPSDTNGKSDVYEWEAKGSGSCESESQGGGCLYLISSGTSPEPSYFGDVSANGDDVFFFTGQQLVPGDRDHLADVYDASVEGGLASQHELTPPTCTGTACQANPAPPPDPTLSSAAFNGPGNVHEGPSSQRCPKGKRKVTHRGKARCVKESKHHKRHQRRANDNRGGQK